MNNSKFDSRKTNRIFFLVSKALLSYCKMHEDMICRIQLFLFLIATKGKNKIKCKIKANSVKPVQNRQ